MVIKITPFNVRFHDCFSRNQPPSFASYDFAIILYMKTSESKC